MNRQYIGARYVPIIYQANDGSSNWEANKTYEPLTIVTYNKNSYTSKKQVTPNIGNPADNENYWVRTGDYNAQINELNNNYTVILDNVNNIVNKYIKKEPLNIFYYNIDSETSNFSAKLTNFINNNPNRTFYIPDGNYTLYSSINITVPCEIIFSKYAFFTISDNFSDEEMIKVQGAYNDKIYISGGIFDTKKKVNGFNWFTGNFSKLSDCIINNIGVHKYGIISPNNNFIINGCEIHGDISINNSIGIQINHKSIIENCYIYNCTTGIFVYGSNNSINNCYIVCSYSSTVTTYGFILMNASYNTFNQCNILTPKCGVYFAKQNEKVSIYNTFNSLNVTWNSLYDGIEIVFKNETDNFNNTVKNLNVTFTGNECYIIFQNALSLSYNDIFSQNKISFTSDLIEIQQHLKYPYSDIGLLTRYNTNIINTNLQLYSVINKWTPLFTFPAKITSRTKYEFIIRSTNLTLNCNLFIDNDGINSVYSSVNVLYQNFNSGDITFGLSKSSNTYYGYDLYTLYAKTNKNDISFNMSITFPNNDKYIFNSNLLYRSFFDSESIGVTNIPNKIGSDYIINLNT